MKLAQFQMLDQYRTVLKMESYSLDNSSGPSDLSQKEKFQLETQHFLYYLTRHKVIHLVICLYIDRSNYETKTEI